MKTILVLLLAAAAWLLSTNPHAETLFRGLLAESKAAAGRAAEARGFCAGVDEILLTRHAL